MKKKAAEVKTTVGDLVAEGKLTPSAEEPTHVYEVETKKIEKIEPALEVTPPAKPSELNQRDLDRLTEKRAKEEIIWRLTERRDLYTAHCSDRGTRNLNISFYTPFLSPVELYDRVKFDVPGLRAFRFKYAVDDLVREGKIIRVTEDTNSSGSGIYPSDFRDADVGNVFLNTPELIAAYRQSVSAAQSPLVEKVKEDDDYFLGR